MKCQFSCVARTARIERTDRFIQLISLRSLWTRLNHDRCLFQLKVVTGLPVTFWATFLVGCSVVDVMRLVGVRCWQTNRSRIKRIAQTLLEVVRGISCNFAIAVRCKVSPFIWAWPLAVVAKFPSSGIDTGRGYWGGKESRGRLFPPSENTVASWE